MKKARSANAEIALAKTAITALIAKNANHALKRQLVKIVKMKLARKAKAARIVNAKMAQGTAAKLKQKLLNENS